MQNTAEVMEFTVDPAIIHHTIQSQAGSLGKALIELVQNAVDAGADRCDIQIERDGFSVQDNGNGFSSRSEVERHFAKFGTPHAEGDATFGRFRIGRGQIMTFASTLWISNVFRMDVDIKNNGLRFNLTDKNPEMKGCRIEGRWYEPLNQDSNEDEEKYFAPMDMGPDPYLALIMELKNSLRYVRIAVYLNGDRISMDCDEEKWDAETEDAYFRLKASGSLAIYNQGVLVREEPGYTFGCGGVIVTKKNILLNVSRTEILRKQCPVWPQIEKVIRKESLKFRSKKDGGKRMDENSRKHAAMALMMGQGDVDAPVITLLPRKHVSLRYLATAYGKEILMAPENDLVRAERVSRSGSAIVLHPSVMDRFNAGTVENLSRILKKAWQSRQSERRIYDDVLNFGDYEKVASAFSGNNTFINAKDLLAADRVIYRAVQPALENFIARIRDDQQKGIFIYTKRMSVMVGRSSSCEAWTNGKTYIAISEQLLRSIVEDGFSGILHLLDVVIHEIAHQGYGETQDAPHDEVFYALFHDITMQAGVAKSRAIDSIIGNYLAICREDKIKPYGWAQKWLPKRKVS